MKCENCKWYKKEQSMFGGTCHYELPDQGFPAVSKDDFCRFFSQVETYEPCMQCIEKRFMEVK